MAVRRLRLQLCFLLAALAAGGASACSINTNATGTGSAADAGVGGIGATAGAGGAANPDSGSGTGGVGGGGAVGGAPAGGSAGAENCFDHQDNDGNGFVDCGDPACQNAGHTCQTSPPPGWEGYFRTAGDAFDTTSPPPPCPDGSPPLKYHSAPGSRTCTPCQCGGLTGGCGAARVDCATNTNCSGATDWSSKFQSCHQAGYPSSFSCRMEAAQPSSGGSCPVSGGQLVDKATWGQWLYACGAPNAAGGGCVQGEACAPPPSGAYSGTVCIRKAGDQKCPAGWSTRLVGYSGGTDTRGCTACNCTPDLTNLTCTTGAYTFYDYSDCSGGSIQVTSTSCVDLSSLLDPSISDWRGDWGGRLTTAPQPANGTCTPSGGEPTGGIDTTGAVTYCCL